MSSSLVEGQQELPLYTTRFEITQPIPLALLSQGKLNKYGIFVLHKWKTIHCKAEKVQKIGHDFYFSFSKPSASPQSQAE
jgi:hypothetical protein